MAGKLALGSLMIVLALPSCGGETQPAAAPPPVTSAVPSASASAEPPPVASASAAPAPAPEPAKPAAPQPVAKYTGLSTPESVLYDADQDRYLVSNVNGKPDDKDDNGFISVLSPDGTVTTLKWIEGGKNKVKLNAPKGLALADGILYVTDIDVVRRFDAKTGAPKGDVAFPGATFLNDAASGPDGKVYISDTGIKFGPKGPIPTKTDAVYVITKGKAKALAKGPDLGGPNGVIVTDKGDIVVVTFGSGEVYSLDAKGKKTNVSKPPTGMLDGLIALGDDLIVTSWEGSAIYKGKLGGTFDLVLGDQKAPADIGYDTKRGRVLVPHFTEDTVEAYDLK